MRPESHFRLPGAMGDRLKRGSSELFDEDEYFREESVRQRLVRIVAAWNKAGSALKIRLNNWLDGTVATFDLG